MWRRRTNGSWKFAVDIGISHAKPPVADEEVTFPSKVYGARSARVAPQKTLVSAREAEDEFIRDATKRGAFAAYETRLSDEARVLCGGALPPVGGETARQLLDASRASSVKWTALAFEVSRSNDLAFGYGSYEQTNGEAKESGNYLRIWRRDPRGGWRIALDIASPTRRS